MCKKSDITLDKRVYDATEALAEALSYTYDPYTYSFQLVLNGQIAAAQGNLCSIAPQVGKK